MSPEALLALLQFSDGLFPAGAYAHSFGLETFVQNGMVRNPVEAEKVLRAQLQGSSSQADAVAVVLASRAFEVDNLRGCLELDLILEAMKPAAELREASRQLGRQTLRTARALIEAQLIYEFARLADSDSTPCHHAVVFGIIAGAHGWSSFEAAAAYLYSSSAAMVGAALRLVPLGQLQGQCVIHRLAPLIASLADDATKLSIAEMSSFAPALEIAAMRHARLDGRLFRS
jgi:urease accessory protein